MCGCVVKGGATEETRAQGALRALSLQDLSLEVLALWKGGARED